MRLLVMLSLVMLFALSGEVSAQSWQPPADSQRCPSKWGPRDQRGSSNHMKPETVLRAARLIKTGEVFELGRVLENLRLDELATRGAHEFALIVEPLKIQGGTGSSVAPIAIR